MFELITDLSNLFCIMSITAALMFDLWIQIQESSINNEQWSEKLKIFVLMLCDWKEVEFIEYLQNYA